MWADVAKNFAARQWAGIASSFLSGIEEAKGPVRDALNELAQWGSYLAGNAVKEWPPVIASGAMCQIPYDGDACDARAMVKCVGCGALCCLAHCAVDYEAHGLCARCIGEFVAKKHGQKYDPRAPKKDEVTSAFKTLGLRRDATLQEVIARQRELAIKHHPDRAKTDAQRVKRSKRMAEINAAVSTLREHLERRAA